MSGPGLRRIPFSNRLGLRFTLPLLAVLAFSSASMILGYLSVRSEALAGAAAQIRQLEAYAAIQEVYGRQWVENNIRHIVWALEEVGPERLYTDEAFRERFEGSVMATMPAERGVLGLAVYLEDSRGARYGVRFTRDEAPLYFTPDSGALQHAFLAASGGASWQTLVTEGEAGKRLTARYYTPVSRRNFQGLPFNCGVLTVDLSMSWLADRILAISTVPSTQVFFMDKEGNWTLPEAPGAELAPGLARLRRLMLGRQAGQTAVTWKNEAQAVIYMPLGSGDLMFAMLIPEARLFSDLDRMLRLFIGAGALLFLFALLFLHRTASLILRPVRELSGIATRLSAGDFSPPNSP
ncbi:MAG: hypothetical protein LBV79_02630, partial [Candidatus Adiutrix sp.]|nr:hypothetical protein [Candidatus Adiutrix sp.]